MVEQKNLKKTGGKVMVGGKERVVYEGPRGGRYVKKGGEFVRVGKEMGGGGAGPSTCGKPGTVACLQTTAPIQKNPHSNNKYNDIKRFFNTNYSSECTVIITHDSETYTISDYQGSKWEGYTAYHQPYVSLRSPKYPYNFIIDLTDATVTIVSTTMTINAPTMRVVNNNNKDEDIIEEMKREKIIKRVEKEYDFMFK